MSLARSPITVEQTDGEIVIRVRAEGASALGDGLVPVTAEGLAAEGLEYRPIVALAQAGTLRTVWIGRKRYTRKSWLVALADKLPPATAEVPDDDVANAARRRARRAAR